MAYAGPRQPMPKMNSYVVRAWQDHRHMFNTCGRMLFLYYLKYTSAQIEMYQLWKIFVIINGMDM